MVYHTDIVIHCQEHQDFKMYSTKNILWEEMKQQDYGGVNEWRIWEVSKVIRGMELQITG